MEDSKEKWSASVRRENVKKNAEKFVELIKILKTVI
jgi:hypothetical protein